jgi:hypothetical protein
MSKRIGQVHRSMDAVGEANAQGMALVSRHSRTSRSWWYWLWHNSVRADSMQMKRSGQSIRDLSSSNCFRSLASIMVHFLSSPRAVTAADSPSATAGSIEYKMIQRNGQVDIRVGSVEFQRILHWICHLSCAGCPRLCPRHQGCLRAGPIAEISSERCFS